MPEESESEARALLTRNQKMKICILTAGGKASEACLFYVAWTTHKNESISFLRKQLRILHTHLISAGTRAII
jgi:hypothetical protein